MSTSRGRPPRGLCLAGGIIGSTMAHCSSVRSEGYIFRERPSCPICARSSAEGICANYLTNLLFCQVMFPDSLLQSAAALRRQHGLCGKPESYDQAYAYLKKRTHWMRYRHCRSQGLPIGSGITEAACKIVFTQRLKCSGMSWTIEGGQVIVDLRVVWLSGV